MSNNQEYKDFKHIKYKASENEKYFITIFDDSGINTVNLNKYEKDKISFGKNLNNDIIIDSQNIDSNQGYFQITEHGLYIKNDSENFILLANKDKEYNDAYMSQGNFIKIVNKDNKEQGIIILLSITENVDEWKEYTLKTGKNTIGCSNVADIVLPAIGVAKKHADIYMDGNKINIIDLNTVNGTYVNGIQISNENTHILNNLDVIIIGNSKIILYEGRIYFQIFERGIRLDAIDIVKNVKVKFKPKQICSNVSMSIKPAEFVAFVGGSGAGKTTFLKAISGISEPTMGKVLLNGENLYENYEELKYNIGYVPQDDIVYSNLTLHDMLSYAAKLRMPDNATKEERENRIKDVLDIVDLNDLDDSYIRQLSGGQRKRASIAVELIADPSLLFLDEPTSGLDPGTERSVMKTLRKMSKLGKTVVLVTHNTLNLHLCDKVAFFGDGGKLCFYGKPEDALKFFGVSDFVDIYTLIKDNTDKWRNEYEASEYYESVSTKEERKESTNINRKKSFFKMLINLITRYIKLIKNDYIQLLILFAQAPIIATLLGVVTSKDIYVSFEDTKGTMFSLACVCIWIGLLNSIQEICKEKTIIQKEYMSNLKLPAYLLSKFIVQGILSFIQSVIIVLIFQLYVGRSEYSLLIGPFWDMQLICFISILSASALGLFVSCLVKNSSNAMVVAPLILVPQLLFCGILFKLKGFTKFISNFIICRWSVEGLGSSLNLNELTHLVQKYNPRITVEAEDFYTYTAGHMLSVIVIILSMTLVFLIASFIALRKKMQVK